MTRITAILIACIAVLPACMSARSAQLQKRHDDLLRLAQLQAKKNKFAKGWFFFDSTSANGAGRSLTVTVDRSGKKTALFECANKNRCAMVTDEVAANYVQLISKLTTGPGLADAPDEPINHSVGCLTEFDFAQGKFRAKRSAWLDSDEVLVVGPFFWRAEQGGGDELRVRLPARR